MEIKSKIITITPEMAKLFLDKSNGNYRFSNTSKTVDEFVVKKYATDMKNGNWKLNPHGIIFDEDGVLIDGHHRLNAVILADKPIDFVVIVNAPKNCITALDSGFKRPPHLILQYTDNVNKLSASKRGWAIARLHFVYKNNGDYIGVRAVPTSSYQDFIVKNADDIQMAMKCAEHERQRQRFTSNAANYYSALCALKCGVPLSKINSFFTIVNTGMYDSKEESAAVVYRNKLLEGTKRNDTVYWMQISAYAQTALYDFVKCMPRTRHYTKTNPVYTTECLKNELL
jgi:hypothetical protein